MIISPKHVRQRILSLLILSFLPNYSLTANYSLLALNHSDETSFEQLGPVLESLPL